jgi:hypothetical protein
MTLELTLEHVVAFVLGIGIGVVIIAALGVLVKLLR